MWIWEERYTTGSQSTVQIHSFDTSGSQIVVPVPVHHLGACSNEHLGAHPGTESETRGVAQ